MEKSLFYGENSFERKTHGFFDIGLNLENIFKVNLMGFCEKYFEDEKSHGFVENIFIENNCGRHITWKLDLKSNCKKNLKIIVGDKIKMGFENIKERVVSCNQVVQ